MALVTVSEVITRFPDFKVVSSDIIQSAIEESSTLTSNTAWLTNPEKARQAQLFITAHKLASEWYETAEIASSAAGIASGQSSGRSGGGYGANDFESTYYGRQYLVLKRSLISTPLMLYG